MRVLFQIVMLLIAVLAASDITSDKKRGDEKTVIEQMGFSTRQKKTDSVILFGISVASVLVMLIVEVAL